VDPRPDEVRPLRCPPVQEVEAKYRVNDVDGLMRVLRERGAVLSAPVHQDDQAYAPAGWVYGQPKVGVAFARLRTEAGRHLFTVKRPIANEMACLEHETEVVDREAMHRALVEIGFAPTVRIVKVRRGGVLGSVSLCVDEVEHAGWFIEFERVVGRGRSGVEIQAELDRLARSLEVELSRVTDTYDSLVRSALVSPSA
jgi:adenylate cyclase, class 2